MSKIMIDGELVIMNKHCSTCGHMIDNHCHDTGVAPPVPYCMDMHNISVLREALGVGCDGWKTKEQEKTE